MTILELINEIKEVKLKVINNELGAIEGAQALLELQDSLINALLTQKKAA